MTEYDDIKEALVELGDTSEAVAFNLIELNCRGHREEGYACPVYRYLTGTKGITGIERVVSDEVWISDEPLDEPGTEPVARIPMPWAVSRFVNEFDRGGWFELEER